MERKAHGPSGTTEVTFVTKNLKTGRVRMDQCFPHLQDLTPDGCELERKQITLAGYTPLLQNCPGLSQLSVATACRSFDTRKALPPGLCNRRLMSLDLPRASIESSVGSIFRCLILMFPNLKSLTIPYGVASRQARKSFTDLQQLVKSQG